LATEIILTLGEAFEVAYQVQRVAMAATTVAQGNDEDAAPSSEGEKLPPEATRTPLTDQQTA
jgi:hypothetical protein